MTAQKGKIARWRNTPNEKGLARVCQGPRGYELREGDNWIINVSMSRRSDVPGGMWYWVGLGRNTSTEHLLFPTKEEAKADADKAYKEWRKAL